MIELTFQFVILSRFTASLFVSGMQHDTFFIKSIRHNAVPEDLSELQLYKYFSLTTALTRNKLGSEKLIVQ